MTTVSLNAGDTGWIDSISCDLCPAKVERKGTGVMKRVPLPITDPRVIEQRRSPHEYFPASRLEIEYEERHFEPDVLKGWGRFLIDRDGSSLENAIDLCPQCAAVEHDSLLERVTSEPLGHVEKDYGKEVPHRTPQIGDQELLRREEARLSRERALAEADAVADAMVAQQPTHSNPRGMGRSGRCRAGGCQESSMLGQWYCYRHAALGGEL